MQVVDIPHQYFVTLWFIQKLSLLNQLLNTVHQAISHHQTLLANKLML